jgi:hypothetical protein
MIDFTFCSRADLIFNRKYTKPRARGSVGALRLSSNTLRRTPGQQADRA